MTVYVCTYHEPNEERIQQVGHVADRFGATLISIDTLAIPRGRVSWATFSLEHAQLLLPETVWVPLELTSDSAPLDGFRHPEGNVVYVVGSQVGTIPRSALSQMGRAVHVETPEGAHSPVLPTPVVVGVTLHHRLTHERIAA